MRKTDSNLNGWIKIHRKMMKWEHFGDVNTHVVFLYLLLNTNPLESVDGAPTRWGARTTEAEISQAFRLTRKQVQTCIQKLLRSGDITRDSSKHLFYISNYEQYQGSREPRKKREEAAKTSGNKQKDANKKQQANEAEETHLATFRLAYNAYPGAKRKAETEFAELRKHSDWLDVLSLLRKAVSELSEAKKRVDLFAPSMRNWLANREWETNYKQIINDKRRTSSYQALPEATIITPSGKHHRG